MLNIYKCLGKKTNSNVTKLVFDNLVYGKPKLAKDYLINY